MPMLTLPEYRSRYGQQVEHLSDDELMTQLHKQQFSNMPFDEFATKFSGERTWGEFAKDSLIDLAQSGVGLVGMGAGAAATLGISGADKLVEATSYAREQIGEQFHSDFQKRLDEKSAQAMNGLRDDGTEKGFFENAGDVLSFLADNPEALASLTFENIGALAGGAAVGIATKGSALALGAYQTLLGAGDGYSSTQERILQTPFEKLAQASDKFVGYIQEGLTPDEARFKLADDAAQVSGYIAGSISGILSKFGGVALEKQLGEAANQIGTRVTAGAAAQSFGKEIASEGLEEMGVQFAGNTAIKYDGVDEDQSLTEGLGGAGALGMAASVVPSAGMGGVSMYATKDMPTQAELDEQAKQTEFDAKANQLAEKQAEEVATVESSLKYGDALDQEMRANLAAAHDTEAKTFVTEQSKAMDTLDQLMPQDPELRAMAERGVPVVEIAPEPKTDAIQPLDFTQQPVTSSILNDLYAAPRLDDGTLNVRITPDVEKALVDELTKAGAKVDPDTGEVMIQRDNNGWSRLVINADGNGRTYLEEGFFDQPNQAQQSLVTPDNPIQPVNTVAEPVQPEIKLYGGTTPFKTIKSAQLGQTFKTTPNARIVPVEGGYGVVDGKAWDEYEAAVLPKPEDTAFGRVEAERIQANDAVRMAQQSTVPEVDIEAAYRQREQQLERQKQLDYADAQIQAAQVEYDNIAKLQSETPIENTALRKQLAEQLMNAEIKRLMEIENRQQIMESGNPRLVEAGIEEMQGVETPELPMPITEELAAAPIVLPENFTDERLADDAYRVVLGDVMDQSMKGGGVQLIAQQGTGYTGGDGNEYGQQVTRTKSMNHPITQALVADGYKAEEVRNALDAALKGQKLGKRWQGLVAKALDYSNTDAADIKAQMGEFEQAKAADITPENLGYGDAVNAPFAPDNAQPVTMREQAMPRGAEGGIKFSVGGKTGGIDFGGQSKLRTDDVFKNPRVTLPRSVTVQTDKLLEDGELLDMPQVDVPVSNIVPTQSFISRSNIDKIKKSTSSTNAELAKIGDKYYVLDGHHRIAKRIANGDDVIQAHVVEVDADGVKFSFAGQKAKTANLENRATAEQMLADGVDADTVWKQTGWEKGADGKWKFEIDDSKVKAKDYAKGTPFETVWESKYKQKGDTVKLPDLIEHDELFAAYPALVDVSVTPQYAGSANGSYDPSVNSISISKNLPADEVVSVLMHEIQHAIQQEENFARGGSSSVITPEQREAALIELEREASNMGLPSYDSKVKDFLTGKITQEEYEDYLWDIASATKENGMAGYKFELYQRLAGETEARNTQARLTLGAEARRNTSPRSTEDVARDKQIVRFEGGRAEMAVDSGEFSFLDKADAKTYRKAIEKIAQERYAGKPPVSVKTKDGEEVVINWQGVKHNLNNGQRTWENALVSLHLEELLSNASLVDVEPNRYGKTEPKEARKYESFIDIDGSRYTAKVTARTHNDGKRYYEHLLVNEGQAALTESAYAPAQPKQDPYANTTTPKSEVNTLTQELAKSKDAQRLMNSGKVEVVQSERDLPADIEGMITKSDANGQVQGLFYPATNKTYLIADNLSAADAMGVLTHEVGVHAWFASANSDKKAALEKRAVNLLKTRGLASGGLRTFLDSVQQRMIKAKQMNKDGTYKDNEEAVAYIVEQAINQFADSRYLLNDNKLLDAIGAASKSLANFIADVITYLKSGMHKLGWMDTQKLTAGDLVAIAKGNMREVAQSDVGVNDGMLAGDMARALASFASDKPTAQEIADAQRELDKQLAIADKLEAEYGYLPAPNGEKSNLNRNQWAQVRTPQFKEWFGDWENDAASASKVVDANGEPMVVYHGTTNANNILKDGFKNGWIHLTDSKFVADSYQEWSRGDSADTLPLYVRSLTPAYYDANGSKYTEIGNKVYRATYDAEKAGKDSLFIKDIIDNYDSSIPTKPHATIVAFNPSQIKSAIGNVGTFSNKTGNIRFSKQGNQANNTQPTFAVPEFGLLSKAQQKLQNNFNRIAQIQEAIVGQGGKVDATSNVYKTEERFWGKVGSKAERFTTEMKQLITSVADANITLEDMENFLYARHAIERNEFIRKNVDANNQSGSGMADKKAADIIGSMVLKHPKIMALADSFDAMTLDTRKMQLEAGLISKQTFDAWGEYKHYVPLKGWADKDNNPMAEFEASRTPAKKGFDVRGAESKKAKGRNTLAAELIENMYQQRLQAIVRAGQNDIGAALFNLVNDNPNQDLWEINAIATSKKQNKSDLVMRFATAQERDDWVQSSGYSGVQLGQVGNAFTATVKDVRTIDVKTTVDKGSDTLALKVGGREVYIKIKDKPLLEQMRQAGVSSEISPILKPLAVTQNWLKRFYTSLNPEFSVINFARDLLTAFVSMPRDTGNYLDSVKFLGNLRVASEAMKYAWQKDGKKISPLLQRYLDNGGSTGFMDFQSIESITTRIDDMWLMARNAKDAGMKDKARTYSRMAWNTTLGAIEKMNEGLEITTRLAAFKTAIEAGKTDAEAANIAKNITVNFNRKGDLAKQLDLLMMFFNPAIQGTKRVAELMSDSKSRNMLMGLVALGFMTALIGGDEEDEKGNKKWDVLSDERKMKTLPFGLGSDMFATVQMPYGVNFFTNIGYALADVKRWYDSNGKHGKSPEEAAEFTLKSAALHLNSFGGLQVFSGDIITSVQAYTPAIVDPLLQVANNKSWADKKLRPEQFDEVKEEMTPDSQKFFAGQEDNIETRIAGWLSRVTGGDGVQKGFIEIAPSTINVTMSAVFGGLWNVGKATATTVAKAANPNEEVEAKDIPVVRKMVGGLSSGDYSAAYREKAEEIKTALGTYDAYVKDGDFAKAREYYRENLYLIEDANTVKAHEKQLKTLRTQRNMIFAQKSLTETQRRERLTANKKQTEQVLMKALKAVE